MIRRVSATFDLIFSIKSAMSTHKACARCCRRSGRHGPDSSSFRNGNFADTKRERTEATRSRCDAAASTSSTHSRILSTGDFTADVSVLDV